MKPVTWKRPPYPKPFRYEDAAWRELAQRFTKSASTGTARGLCSAITYLYWQNHIDWDMKRRMTRRVDDFVGSAGQYAYESNYGYTTDFIPNREARVLACLWLALDSQIDP